jgi:hypothetical protein
MAILETEVLETATAADFAVPEHEHDFRVGPGVCSVCGAILIRVNDLGGQPEAPRFGADEYLIW